MAYTNSILIGNYLQRTLNADETTFLAVLIPAIQRWIDGKLSSTFDIAVPSTRYFDGGVRNLDIDPCTAITSVKTVNDDTTLSDSYSYTLNSEYRQEPVNETVKRELRKIGGCFPSGVANVAVTASFSEYNGGVPEDIELAATIMAAEVLNQGSLGSTGIVESESLEGHSITYDTSSSTLEGISDSNPSIKSIFDQRRELFVG